MFCKKFVPRNFAKFTGKHLCQSLFFNKVAGLRPATLLKKRLWHRCFPVNFPKFLGTPFLQNTSRRLLLKFSTKKFFTLTRRSQLKMIITCSVNSEKFMENSCDGSLFFSVKLNSGGSSHTEVYYQNFFCNIQ